MRHGGLIKEIGSINEMELESPRIFLIKELAIKTEGNMKLLTRRERSYLIFSKVSVYLIGLSKILKMVN